MTRRAALGAPIGVALAAPKTKAFVLAMHQTTQAGSDFRRSLEGCAKAGILHVEIIPPLAEPFIKKEGVAAAKKLLGDLGITAPACGGARGLVEPNPERAQALDELKRRLEWVAALGMDRIVAPCPYYGKATPDDLKRASDNLREAGEIAAQFKVALMLEFMRGSTLIGTLPTALKVVRGAAHPWVKPMFDFYHFMAGLSRMDDLDLVHPGEFHHVHLQDLPDLPREFLDNTTREVPGDGVGPVVALLKKVKATGYRGPLSVELFHPRLQKGDPLGVAQEIRRKSEAVMRKAGLG
ncbi:MAG: sugar phosphate isomerase/epimerase family protein [Bryobacteraceae bacterium]